MSPKNIFNQSNVNLGYNLTWVTWINLGLNILKMIWYKNMDVRDDPGWLNWLKRSAAPTVLQVQIPPSANDFCVILQ